MGETQKVRDTLLFTLLHEIGHVLLRQWSYPFHDNGEVAVAETAVVELLVLDNIINVKNNVIGGEWRAV